MVSISNTLRPTGVITAILSGTTDSGVSVAGDDYFIAVNSATMTHSTQLQEITGDGDTSPRFIANYYLYADWVLRGYAVAGQAIGILAMTSTSSNPTDQGAKVDFTFASGRVVKGIFWVHGVVIEWSRTSGYVGLSLRLKNTAVDATGAISYEEATS